MRGTFVYDIITTVGIVLLVFLIIYWSVQFGTDMLAGMFLSDPATLQGTLASAISFSCRPYNYEFNYTGSSTVPATIDLNEKSIHIIPPAKKFVSDWRATERGGSIRYRGISETSFITCGQTKVSAAEINFPETKSIKFSVSKKIGSVSLKVG